MKKSASKDKQDNSAAADPYRAVTTAYLMDWAGTAVFSRGQSYHRELCVEELRRTKQGEILAWVQGTHRYAVLLDATSAGQLESVCTCPYADRCKHAVAALLEYQRMLLEGKPVTLASVSDARFALIDAAQENDADDDDDTYEDGDENEDAFPHRAAAPTKRSAALGDNAQWFDALTKNELLALVRGIQKRHPGVLDGLESAHAMTRLPRSSSVKTLEREIDRVTAEEAWWDGWKGRGHIPDYSGIRSGLNALLKQGGADAVVLLGDRMLQRMKTQVERSNDDGLTAEGMIAALEPVFAALKASSLSPIQQMLKAHAWSSADEYGLCSGLDAFWSRRFAQKTWSEFADTLIQQLDTMGNETDGVAFRRQYRRDRLGDAIVEALEKAGRAADALALCEREAPLTLNYGRVVERLMARGRIDDAEKWIRDGVSATHASAPGIASELRARLRELRGKQSDWPFVAAMQAEEFYTRANLRGWHEMRTACEKAAVWPEVRSQALSYLRTGSSLLPGDDAWPLPKTGLPGNKYRAYGPLPVYDLLLEIAIGEGDFPEVMRLYEQYRASLKTSASQPRLSDDLLDRIAASQRSALPDVAVSIWNGIALKHIAMTKPAEYEIAVRYLKKTRQLLHSLKRDDEWRSFYRTLLDTEKRKPRFIQIAIGALGSPT